MWKLTCQYYAGDEDCDKCIKHGIICGYNCECCEDYKDISDQEVSDEQAE